MDNNFDYSALEVSRNGYEDMPFIDIDLHDDNQPEDAPSVVGRISMTPPEAKELIARLSALLEN